MFSFLSSGSTGGLKLRKNSAKGPSYVARDDLDVKHKNSVIKRATEPLQQEMKHADAYENKNRDTTRVKVLMTKEEATKLLSKCNSRGALGFKDVAIELMQIPVDRVSVVCLNSPNSDAMLENKSKAMTRVKVLMTKEEAAKLLSKCNSRGALSFKDVATELMQIPVDRVSVVYPNSPNSDAMLENKSKDTTRVKVLMTKEEAAKLLSKSNSRRALSFKDVATELMQIPIDRVSVVCPNNPNSDAMLESIPEEP